MSDAATTTRAGGPARHARRRGRRWPRIALLGGLATMLLAAFPSPAGAFAPLLGPVSAEPTMNGATLKATIYPYGLDTTYHFEYGPTNTYGTSTSTADAGSAPYPTSVPVQATISGLTANTTYHFRVVASNSDPASPVRSSDSEFTTTGTPPAVSDEAAVELTGTSFELKGKVNPNGSATSYQFEYGTSTSPYQSKIPVSEASVGSAGSDVPVTQTVTNLLPSTLYHFRLTARHPGSPASAVFTVDRTFTTPAPPPGAPVAVVEAPTKVAGVAGSYKLNGQVNPNNLATTYRFEFGESAPLYGTNLPVPDGNVPAGSSNVHEFQEVTGLQPNTVYHYRIHAHNNEGDSTSVDEEFTTAPEPPVTVSMPATESPQGFVLNGTVNAKGGHTTYHFQFGVTTKYGTSVPEADADAGEAGSPVPVSQLVTGLPPGVPYHYRLVATNGGGTTMGEDEFFMTPAAPETPPAEPEKKPPSLTPPPIVPSNHFSVGAATLAGSAATLKVSVPGAGTVSVSGKQLKLTHVSSGGSGTVALKLKLTPAGVKALKKHHKLKVKVTITYAPNGGAASSTTKVVTFKAKP